MLFYHLNLNFYTINCPSTFTPSDCHVPVTCTNMPSTLPHPHSIIFQVLGFCVLILSAAAGGIGVFLTASLNYCIFHRITCSLPGSPVLPAWAPRWPAEPLVGAAGQSGLSLVLQLWLQACRWRLPHSLSLNPQSHRSRSFVFTSGLRSLPLNLLLLLSSYCRL